MKKNPIHDFTSKLIQSEVIENLKNYVRWQQDLRKSSEPSTLFEKVPDHAPISINLDLTTACNYACDHCVDIDILNTGIRFEYEKLEKSIDQMAFLLAVSCRTLEVFSTYLILAQASQNNISRKNHVRIFSIF